MMWKQGLIIRCPFQREASKFNLRDFREKNLDERPAIILLFTMTLVNVIDLIKFNSFKCILVINNLRLKTVFEVCESIVDFLGIVFRPFVEVTELPEIRVVLPFPVKKPVPDVQVR